MGHDDDRRYEPKGAKTSPVISEAVFDETNTYLLSGNGDVIEPDHGVISIGSGSAAAQAAATALMQHTDMSPKQIVTEAMAIAASLCIYTNTTLTLEEIINE